MRERTLAKHQRIYVDLEYCYPGMNRESGRPDESALRQIVQIAAIKTDTKTGKEIASLDILVRPAFEKKLPPFFIELTGITEQMVNDHGIAFSDAYTKFIRFCDIVPIWTFHNDWRVLKQNCGYFDIPLELKPFTEVRGLLSGWGVDPTQYSSGTLHRAAEIEMHGHVHNALYDVRSMAAAVHYFETHNQE